MTDINFDNVDLGFVVNLQILKDVMKDLSIDGRRWWVASDPEDAAAVSSLTIGFGDQNCKDRLNTLYFEIPVVSSVVPRYHRARLILLFDSSCVKAEGPGFYKADDSIVQDDMEDFLEFFRPLKSALAARIQSDSRSPRSLR
jgi:hypothetical protein